MGTEKNFNENDCFFENGEKAVLLLHAYTGTPNDVRMLARFFEMNHYTVLAPLFSGHGTSKPEDILEVQPVEWMRDTSEKIHFLKEKGYEKIAVFGLSMGGVFAMNSLRLTDPAILGAGAFCSPITPEPDHDILTNFIKYCRAVFKKKNLSEEEISVKISQLEPQLIAQLAGIEKISQEVYDFLPQIELPVFLAQAGRDEMIAAKGVYQTAGNLMNSEVTLHYYPKATHVITIGNDRKKLEKDLLAFLETLPWNEET